MRLEEALVMTYSLPTTWSPQQQAVIDFCVSGSGSAIVDAVAGSGKTTTLLKAATAMSGKVAILAYNNKIGKEIKGKLEDLGIDWRAVNAGTVHSFGFKALNKTFANIKVDEKKIENILVTMSMPGEMTAFVGVVAKLVSLAKQKAIGVIDRMHDVRAWREIIEHFDVLDEMPEDQTVEEVIALSIRALKASNANTAVIDFDDMVYLPLIHPVRFFRYNALFLDEAQDTNPARRELVKRLLAPGGRLIAVGDQHQAIYGFTGADNDSLDIIARDFNATRMPLSVTYRCPKAVVAFAHQWVSHIEAHPQALEGSVSVSTLDQVIASGLGSDWAILCRNTKPLVALAFNLIRRRIPCKVEGRDIAEGLIKLARRWKVSSLNAYEDKLIKYAANQRKNFADNPKRLEVIEDRIATLQVLMDQCRLEKRDTVAGLVSYIDAIFADDVHGVVVLSTIHKAKGREWDNVIWLDRAKTCPSKYATQTWMMEQETNLQYVLATRALKSLIEINSPVASNKAPEGASNSA